MDAAQLKLQRNQKKINNEISSEVRSNPFFYCGFLLLYLKIALSSITLIEIPEMADAFLLASGCLSLIAHCFVHREEFRDRACIVYLAAAFLIVNYYLTGITSQLTAILFIFASSFGVDVDRFVAVWFKLTAVFFVLLVLIYTPLYMGGSHFATSVVRPTDAGDRIRLTFFFIHPNGAATVVLMLVAAYLYIRSEKKLGVVQYAIAMAGSAFVLLTTDSRTSGLLIVLLCVLYLIAQNTGAIKKRVVRLTVAILPSLLFLITYLLSGPLYSDAAGSLFTGRVWLWHTTLMNSGLTIWGKRFAPTVGKSYLGNWDASADTLDGFYATGLMTMGLVVSVIICVLVYRSVQTSENGDRLFYPPLVIMLLHGVTEFGVLSVAFSFPLIFLSSGMRSLVVLKDGKFKGRGCFKRALILAPHQDDELNIAGQIIPALIESGCNCNICFSTNGDAYRTNGYVRLREAERVADKLKVGRSGICLLGFDDSMGPNHPYNRRSSDAVVSAPMTRSYSARYPSCSKIRTGHALLQCRETLIEDIAYLLESLRPDLIVCVDYDSHPDHRALSLAFEAAIGQIMLKDSSYAPLVLKKFAYSSVWYGADDYWEFCPTEKPSGSTDLVLENPMYTWDERVVVAPAPSTITRGFFSNGLVRAAFLYASQNAWYQMAGACNSDVVYWVRRTDNLLYRSKATSTSGELSILYDYRLFDSTDICSNDLHSMEGWHFKFGVDDKDRVITLTFDAEVRVAEILIREPVGHFGSIEADRVIVTFNQRIVGKMKRSIDHPGRLVLSKNEDIDVKSVDIDFGNAGDFVAIAALEVYPVELAKYEPLNRFVNLLGKPTVMEPSLFSPAPLLRQVSRVTRKLEYISLKLREKRYGDGKIEG